MAVYKVQSPDGKTIRIEGPDGASDEEIIAQAQKLTAAPAAAPAPKAESSMPSWMADALKYGPGFLQEQSTNLVRGGGKALSNAATTLAKLSPLVPSSLANAADKAFQGEIDAALPVDPNETDPQKLMRKVSEGAGAGALGAPRLAYAPAAAAVGGMSALGADMGGNLAEKSGLPRLSGELPGGLLLGGLSGYMLGPKLSAAEDDLSRASRGLTNEQIAAAIAKQKMFDKSGAKSAVLADTLPTGSPLRSLTNNVRNSEIGNPLSIKTQGREQDLEQLGQRYMDNLGPKIEPAKVATQLSDSANDFLVGQERLRSDAIANRLTTAKPPPQVEVFKLYRELAAMAKNPKSPASVSDPYAMVAKELLNKDGSPITNPQQLSFQIKQLKARDSNPFQQNTGGTQISPGFLKDAILYAEQRLGDIIPEYKAAMGEFRDFTRRGPQSTQTLGDLQNSPIRRMADGNPSLENPTPVSKLGMLTAPENAPATSAGIARLLSNPGMTQGRTVDPAAVLRGRTQMQLAENPTGVGNLVGGSTEENIAAVLASIGKNADDVMAPAKTARELQGSFRSAPNINEVARMHPLQAAIRLLRTADMTLTRAQQLKYAEQMGQILSQPAGKEVFAELQRLAQHDPAIRQQLATIVPLMGTLGSNP